MRIVDILSTHRTVKILQNFIKIVRNLVGGRSSCGQSDRKSDVDRRYTSKTDQLISTFASGTAMRTDLTR